MDKARHDQARLQNGALRVTAVLLALLLLFPFGCRSVGSRIPEGHLFDVRDYGATGDGKTRDTDPIQVAIDACARAGGGTVYLGPGSFLSGTLLLKSNVTLFLEAGSRLLGSTDLDDYPVIRPQLRSFTDNYVDRSLLYAEGEQNISIAGRGTIDGQGDSFPKTHWREKARPYLIRFVDCQNLNVQDVTLRNSAMWMQHYLACEGLTIRGIRVYNHSNQNNDMLDIDGCRDVSISDCIGDTEDDAITLKSTLDRPTENVAITNCVVSSHCNAIKCGTESNGGFRNIVISNIVIKPSRCDKVIGGRRNGLAGIALEIVDGGVMDNVLVSNIAMEKVGGPIFVRLGNRARPFREGMERPGVGSLRNVTISNIQAEGADRNGSSVTGLPGFPVENITLEQIRIRYEGGGSSDDALRGIPELEANYPEHNMFGILPAYGLYVRHAKNVKLRNLDLGFQEKDHRPALVLEDVNGLEVSGLHAQATPRTKTLVWLKQVQDAFIHGCHLPGKVAAFVRLDGDRSDDVTLLNNDVRGAVLLLERGPESSSARVVLDETVTRGGPR